MFIASYSGSDRIIPNSSGCNQCSRFQLVAACTLWISGSAAHLDLHSHWLCSDADEFDSYDFVPTCNSLTECYMTVISYGVRSTGGIGEYIHDYYISRSYFAYDMLFYFVICIVILNVIFGIILDTFSDLRQRKQGISSDIRNTCEILI